MPERVEYTPYTLPLIVAAAIAVGLGVFVLRRRQVPGRVSFSLLMLAVAVWSVGYALEIGATDYAVKIFWAKVQYLGIATIPLLWICFVLFFVGESQWLTPGRFAILAIPPAVTLTFAWFNERVQLIWAEISVDNSLGFAMLDFEYGAGLYLHATYSYLLLLAGALLLFRAIIRLPRLGARQVAVVLVAALAPWAGNVLYLTGTNPFPLLDLTPFSFVLSGLAVVWGMGRFRFMSTVPVAHRAIIEGMQAGVVALDRDGHVVELNPAAENMFDLRSEYVVGRLVDRVFAGSPEVIEWLTAEQETTMRATLFIRGVWHEFDVDTMLLYDRRRHVGRLITFHDISKLAAAEREAEQAREVAEAASRAKSQFLANVSHEIRTPLNAIVGMTDLTLEGELAPKQREYLQVARSSTDSLLSIINDILDVSKIEESKLVLDRVDFDLPRMVEDTIQMLSVTVAGKRLALRSTIDPGAPRVVAGDPLRLRQVLFNLLSNAIKFTKSGEVHVDVRLADDTAAEGRVGLRLAVSDTGIGISPEDRERIFESFAQADASTTRIYGGTGLGLSIASHLVNLMDGRIEVDSELGKGSTFTFWVQIFESDVDPAALSTANILTAPPLDGSPDDSASAAPAAADTDTEGAVRVLVADDNIINQRLSSALLQSRGYAVTIVGDGREAVEALAANDFDLVLMDVQMPKLDGVEATRAVRETEEWTGRHVPIIALTAHAMAGDRERFLEAGMDAYVPKPLDAKVLFATMAQLLAATPADGAEAPAAEPAGSGEAARELAETSAAEPAEAVRELAETSAAEPAEAVQELAEAPAAELVEAVQEVAGVPAIARVALDEATERGIGESVVGETDAPAEELEPGYASVIDRETALRKLGGDVELLAEIIDIYLEDAPQVFARLRKAVHSGDAEGVWKGAHRLKGSVGSLSATLAFAAARELESVGREGDLAAVPVAFAALETEMERLEEGLEELRIELSA